MYFHNVAQRDSNGWDPTKSSISGGIFGTGKENGGDFLSRLEQAEQRDSYRSNASNASVSSESHDWQARSKRMGLTAQRNADNERRARERMAEFSVAQKMQNARAMQSQQRQIFAGAGSVGDREQRAAGDTAARQRAREQREQQRPSSGSRASPRRAAGRPIGSSPGRAPVRAPAASPNWQSPRAAGCRRTPGTNSHGSPAQRGYSPGSSIRLG